MSLHVVAVIPIDPARAEEAAPVLASLATATRDEEGCLAYDVFESASTPGTFVTVEEWTDQSALDGHLSQPHTASAIETATPMLVGEIAIHPLTPR